MDSYFDDGDVDHDDDEDGDDDDDDDDDKGGCDEDEDLSYINYILVTPHHPNLPISPSHLFLTTRSGYGDLWSTGSHLSSYGGIHKDAVLTARTHLWYGDDNDGHDDGHGHDEDDGHDDAKDDGHDDVSDDDDCDDGDDDGDDHV